MEGELPKELIDALGQKERAQMKHNWMYSFMPLHDEIYLVGYCKTCDTSVSSVVETDYHSPQIGHVATLSKSNIPKWGCVPVGEISE